MELAPPHKPIVMEWNSSPLITPSEASPPGKIRKETTTGWIHPAQVGTGSQEGLWIMVLKLWKDQSRQFLFKTQHWSSVEIDLHNQFHIRTVTAAAMKDTRKCGYISRNTHTYVQRYIKQDKQFSSLGQPYPKRRRLYCQEGSYKLYRWSYFLPPLLASVFYNLQGIYPTYGLPAIYNNAISSCTASCLPLLQWLYQRCSLHSLW